MLLQAAGAQESRFGPWPSQGPALVAGELGQNPGPCPAPGQHLSLQRVASQDSLVTLFASSPERALSLPRETEARPAVTPGCPIHLLQEPPPTGGSAALSLQGWCVLAFCFILITFDIHLYIYIYLFNG